MPFHPWMLQYLRYSAQVILHSNSLFRCRPAITWVAQWPSVQGPCARGWRFPSLLHTPLPSSNPLKWPWIWKAMAWPCHSFLLPFYSSLPFSIYFFLFCHISWMHGQAYLCSEPPRTFSQVTRDFLVPGSVAFPPSSFYSLFTKSTHPDCLLELGTYISPLLRENLVRSYSSQRSPDKQGTEAMEGEGMFVYVERGLFQGTGKFKICR